MEPLTALAVIATKHGVAGLVGALTGDQTLSELAVELVGALAESENRLAERLAGIEQRLDEVLEQPYSIAIGTGLRTLLDAGRTTDASLRTEELNRARDTFRGAVASARTSLQTAVAERYLALCAVALGRQETARTALEQLNVAAFGALLDAVDAAGQAHAQARKQIEGTTWFRRDERIFGLGNSIVDAAAQAGELAGHLLREAGVLAEGIGDGPLPTLRKRPARRNRLQPDAFPVDRWEIRPSGGEPARFGPISVTWHSVVVRQDEPSKAPTGPILPGRVSPAPVRTVDVDVTVRTEPVLSRNLSISFENSPVRDILATGLITDGALRAGQRELRLRRAVTGTGPSYDPTLHVGGVLLFRPAARQPR
jgi:hypothetical protein